MADPQPVVCVFFQLPPSDQLFARIHDIAWLVLLPQLEKLTYALEALLVTNPSSTAMKTLVEARKSMGYKMLPIRDAILESQSLSIHYLQFIDGASHGNNLDGFVKEVQTFVVNEATEKIGKAQQAVLEFREELESVVARITSSVGGDKNHLSSFVTESTRIFSVMIPAIEECSALLQEFNECFENIHKQIFDRESFKRNPPSDAEFQLAREKWEMLRDNIETVCSDWNTLKSRMASPHFNRSLSDTTTPDVRDTAALTGLPENLVNPEAEAAPEPLPPKRTRIPFWRKFFQRVSSCISSRPFC